ncbi:gamma-glutamyltransferase family protein [Paracoccus suum]|uniref:Gamma-glutamyltransferase family protein n=1 Tax=Paracoccus suum TaxID=2259340 RepID=A0A344PKR9_9RHOB|nr:gamma-glutamyltransferase family protein [Paracoccus suum]AXC49974.1 gamma-glutamyltransferase family protein [Paracoccus suum]
MSDFTTRPEIRGTFGAVTSTHWIASASGMAMLERGGNAFDAAVATGLVLQIVEPHLCGPGGDLPVIYKTADGEPQVLCAQGTAPAAATAEAFAPHKVIPGSGLLATVVPGAFDGWMSLLAEHGRLPLSEVMGPAIFYAREGHPVLPRVAATIAGLKDFFASDWPTSAEVWCAGGSGPAVGGLLANPALAATYQRIVDEAEAASDDRTAQIEAARAIWSDGFVADAIGAFTSTAELSNNIGGRDRALLSRDDLAGWRCRTEAPLSIDYHGWQVFKTGPWGQGPVLLQALAILRGIDLAAMDPMGEEFVHTVIEAMKLAFADREAFYGDPDFADIPMDVLLSEEYASARRALITDVASREQRPGRIPGYEPLADAAIARASGDFAAGPSVEPTMAHMTERRGDTVHLDVIDRWGNVVSATPSGGWLQSSPIVPGLGFALNSRAQMFWLEPGSPSSLQPGARPRTTLTPSLATKDGRWLSFGTPGGDQQDQWQLIWFLRFVHHGDSAGSAPETGNLQALMDMPLFHSTHFQGSFYPRRAEPAKMLIEETIGEDVIAALRARGHEVDVAPAWSIGRLTAALREPDGVIRAAATPRLMQAYAVGR